MGESHFHLSVNQFLIHSCPKKETEKDKGKEDPASPGS